MIELSVCIPMFRAKYIGWVAMESLCRQENVNFEWELVVAEELHDEEFGEQEVMKYEERLTSIGCKKIVYIGLDKWIPLSNKYVITAAACSDSSHIYASQGADIYSQPHRLKTQYDSFINDIDVDLCVGAKTIYYDVVSEKTFLYKSRLEKGDGSDRSFRLELIKALPLVNRLRGVDGWLITYITEYLKSKNKKIKYEIDTSDNWKYGIDVHGIGNLSTNRYIYFEQTKLYADKGMFDCPIDINQTIPPGIIQRLKDSKKYVKLHKDGLVGAVSADEFERQILGE